MINGQKIFIEVISGTAYLAVSVRMDDLFRGLTTQEPGNSLLQW
jgi:hypothetical protein